MADTLNLLPCPFCGGPVKLERTTGAYETMHGQREWWGVVCRNTLNVGGTCAIQQTPSASQEAAVERWNRRASPAAAVPDGALPEMLTNAAHVTRRIRRCEGDTAAQLVLEHFAREYARAAVEADRAQQGEPVGDLYTCDGKGGEYEVIGIAKGAGATRHIENLAVYRDTASGALYFRAIPDFDARMVPLPRRAATKAAAPADAPEPLAWESTTPVYIRYITDSLYKRLRPAFQKWYRPICQKCAAAPVPDTGIPTAGEEDEGGAK